MIKYGRTPRGFTLIELVMVVVITGIIAGMVAVFIRAPVQSYFDTEARAGLTDAADTALRRIGRDLRLALPNSLRISNDGTALEFLQTRTGGRYRAETTGAGAGNPLRPGDVASGSFDVLGALPVAPANTDQIVIYNLGIDGADAYSGNNRVAIAGTGPATATATSTIALGANMFFPWASPGQRFHVIEGPVIYRCANGLLTRHWGHAIAGTWESQPPNPPVGGTRAVLAENVSGCTFNYTQNIVNQRWGLVAMTLTLTSNNETVTLYHEVHVSNIP